MTLLRVLWSITLGSWLTALVLVCIRLLLRRVLSPKAKYYLWLLLALRLMLPVLPQSAMSIQNLLPQRTVSTASAAVLPSGTADAPAMMEAIPDASADPADASPAAPSAAPAASASSPAPAARTFSLSSVLLLLYGLGVGITAAVYLLLYLRTARMLRRLPACQDAETLAVWNRLCSRLSLSPKISLKRGSQGMSGGLLRPVAVLPLEITGEDAAPILLHEAQHLRARDLWLMALYRLLRCVYWFNPVVWLCFRQAFFDSESACDQRVLESGLVSGQDYAQALYRESLLASPDGLYLRTAFGGKHTIRRRIAQIIRFHGTRRWMLPLALVLALLVTACTMTSGSDSGESASAPAAPTQRAQEEAPSAAAPVSLTEADPKPYVPLTFDGENACISGLSWNSTPEAVMQTMGYSKDQFQLTNRGKNFSASVEAPLADHPEVRKIVYEFHLTDLELTKGLDQVEIFYEDGYYDADALRNVCTDILGQPDTDESSWTRFPVSAVTLSDVNNLKLSIHWSGRGTEGFIVDTDSYMESLMPPSGHYGWTLQQHVDAGLLDLSSGTLSAAEDGSQAFDTTISLGGRDVEAVFFFVEPLVSKGSGTYVLTEVYVLPPEDIPFSQWLSSFSDSFTDKMYERSQRDYITPLMVGNLLTDEQKDAVNEAAIAYTGGGASTEGWPLACNWYDTSAKPALWKFNGTGYALYLAITAQSAD